MTTTAVPPPCGPCPIPEAPWTAGLGARWACPRCGTNWSVRRSRGRLHWVRPETPPGHARWAGTEPVDPPDPDLDDLTRAQLAELGGVPLVVSEVLEQWVGEVHAILPKDCDHHVGLFLDTLAARGYRVAKIDPGPPLSELLPPPKE